MEGGMEGSGVFGAASGECQQLAKQKYLGLGKSFVGVFGVCGFV